jgi:hypothetical protein
MDSSTKHKRIVTYSRALTRGVIGDSISGRSREGRYLRALERDLLDQHGGVPTVSSCALSPANLLDGRGERISDDHGLSLAGWRT